MESLAETLLTLIPIALFIAFRMAASKKEQQQLQDKASLEGGIKPKINPKIKQAQAASPVQQAYKPAFNIDEPTPRPIAQWEDIPQAKKAAVHESTMRKSTGGGEMSNGEAQHQTASAAQKTEETSFFHQLDRLSPLQRAVVYAEVLGPPKGMVDNRNQQF